MSFRNDTTLIRVDVVCDEHELIAREYFYSPMAAARYTVEQDNYWNGCSDAPFDQERYEDLVQDFKEHPDFNNVYLRAT